MFIDDILRKRIQRDLTQTQQAAISGRVFRIETTPLGSYVPIELAPVSATLNGPNDEFTMAFNSDPNGFADLCLKKGPEWKILARAIPMPETEPQAYPCLESAIVVILDAIQHNKVITFDEAPEPTQERVDNEEIEKLQLFNKLRRDAILQPPQKPSLFSNKSISEDDRNLILSFLHTPTADLWRKVADIKIHGIKTIYTVMSMRFEDVINPNATNAECVVPPASQVETTLTEMEVIINTFIQEGIQAAEHKIAEIELRVQQRDKSQHKPALSLV